MAIPKTERTMILEQAKVIALDVWNKLKPHCNIIKIAGSVRREKPDVKDIEIVALPKTFELKDLFGATTGHQRVTEWFSEVQLLGEPVKGNAGGKYMQIKLKDHDLNLDLFMPDDFDYWRQFTIRTGSAEWVSRFISGGWSKLGWCGSDVGLRLKSQCVDNYDEKTKKHNWKCVVPPSQQTKPPAWKSEKDFFEWLGLSYVEPKYRNI